MSNRLARVCQQLIFPITRHTVSHGINQYEEVTMEKALQLILIIDQLSYIYQTI